MITGTDIIEHMFVRFHMAPHESAPPSPQSSMEEGGESTPEEGGEEHPKPEGAEGEPPLSLVDLLGFVELWCFISTVLLFFCVAYVTFYAFLYSMGCNLQL